MVVSITNQGSPASNQQLVLQNNTTSTIKIHTGDSKISQHCPEWSVITQNYAVANEQDIIMPPGSKATVQMSTAQCQSQAASYALNISSITLSATKDKVIQRSSGKPSASFECSSSSCNVVAQNFPATYLFSPSTQTETLYACTTNHANTSSITFSYDICS